MIFRVFIICFCVFMYCMTYSSTDSFFTINNILLSVNNSNLILVIFKQASHANPGNDKNELNLVHIF